MADTIAHEPPQWVRQVADAARRPYRQLFNRLRSQGRITLCSVQQCTTRLVHVSLTSLAEHSGDHMQRFMVTSKRGYNSFRNVTREEEAMSAEEIEITNTDETQETLHRLKGHVIVLEWAVGALLAVQFAAHRDGFLEKISQLTLEPDTEGDSSDSVRRGFEKAKIVLAEPLQGLSDDVLRKALQADVKITIGLE